MEEQVPDWAQDSAIPDWAKDDSSDTSITPKAPETDKAAWEQIRDFAKAPSPSWLQKIEEPVRGFLNQPALPDPATIRAFRQKMGFSDQPASGADLVEGWYNAARGMVTPANAVIAAGMAAQPETVPYLLPFMFAPMAAEQPDRWKRVIQGQADLKETGETQAQTAMLLAPLIHAGAAKATDAAFPVPPTLPRPGVTALSPIEYVRKYQQAPEDLTGIPDQPQAETPPVASQEVPGSPGFARFQGEVTPQETDESAQARAHAAMKKLDDLGGNWEYIHQALTEEHGEPPTYGELANELEDEIKDLTSTPREALKNYEIGLARRRTRQAQAREDALAQQEGREPNKVPTITPAQIRADYLRREAEATRVWMEQAFPKKSGEQPVRQKGVKYAKQPGYAQMEEGPTSLGIETRPGGQVPGPGNRYQTERGAQGEATGRPVSPQPRPSSEPVAPAPPATDEPASVKPKTFKPTTAPAAEPELAPEPASEAPSPRQARGQAFKIVGPREANTYKHTGTGLIVRGRKSPQTGQWTWEAIHPDTGEVLNVQTSRRRAMDANLAGALEQPKPPAPEPAPAKPTAPEPVEPLAKLGEDFEKNHGKPMTPQEEKQAQKIVERAKSDEEEYQKAHQDLIKALDTEYGRLKGPEITSKKDLGKLLSDPDKEVC